MTDPVSTPPETAAHATAHPAKPKTRTSWLLVTFAFAAGAAGATAIAQPGVYTEARETVEHVIAAYQARSEARKSVPVEVPPPSVTVAKAETRDLVETVLMTGTLVPREEVYVAAEIDGQAVIEILVEEGDRVEAGQVMARLSTTTLDVLDAQLVATAARAEAAILQASAQINEAEAGLQQADQSFQRIQALRKSGTVAAAAFDDASAQRNVSIARVATARQGLALAEAEKATALASRRDLEIRRERSEIKAPVAGVVTRKTIRLGQIAAMASGPLFTLIRDGAIELEADASETTLARIKPGQIVKVAPPGGAVVEGRVRLVAPEVNRATRLGRVRVAIDNATGLSIGAFARGTVEIAAANGVTVPLSAVQFDANRATVQVVDGNRIETRTVELGLRADGFVQIVSGLSAGAQVVSRAGTFVRDGDKVTPVDLASGARS